jgi:signal transduction histidine kinase
MTPELFQWSGEFADERQEAAFREEYVGDTRRHARLTLLICAVLYIAMLPSDLGYPYWVAERLPLRLLVTATGLVLFWRCGRSQQPADHDRIVFAFGMVVVASFSLIAAQTGAVTTKGHVSFLLLTAASFIGLPMSLRWSVILAGTCLVSFIAIMIALASPDWTATSVEMVFVALASGLLMRYLHILRRRAFYSLCREQAAASDATRHQREAECALHELARAQQQLVLQEKMASAGTLTAGMAHEINNPANFAHAGAQAMQDHLERFRTFLLGLAEGAEAEVLHAMNLRIDELAAQLRVIIEGTSRICTLVKSLRSFSRLGHASFQATAIDECLQSTIQLVQSRYTDSVDFCSHIDADLQLDCRAAQLNQVFMNLIVNACQAIEASRRDRPAAPRGMLRIHARRQGPDLSIDFEDNGCGMSPDVSARIFDPFFTTRTVGEGVGLGLAISFAIVQDHGGHIDVRSIEGQGTRITVSLPLSQKAAP